MLASLEQRWRRGWMRLAQHDALRPLAARLAGYGMPPAYGRVPLSRLHAGGYISPSAEIAHPGFATGKHCFVSDRVLILQDGPEGGEVVLGNRVHLHRDTVIQCGDAGSVRIDDGTHVQPRCQFSAYRGAILIGKRVEIAPNCAFYPYNHGMAAGTPIQQQPTYSRGGIVIGDDAWLGFGVIVLDGVRIGAGAVVGAGSVVTMDVPDNAIAVGVPARVVGSRVSS
jgi:acetyltransferase-like isoleucine patch superfamily enzyme